MKKKVIISSFLVMLTVLVIFLTRGRELSPVSKQSPVTQTPTPQISEPRRATLTGTYICLPFKDDGKPHNDICKFGIRTDSGNQYAVDFSASSQEPSTIKIGTRFSASGTITPLIYLSTNYWDQFEIEGIFSITDSVKEL